MKSWNFAGLMTCLFLFFSSLAFAQKMTMQDSVTYAFGVTIGEDLKAAGLKNVDKNLLMKAIDEALMGKATISAAEAKAIVNNYKVQAAKKEGEDFLAQNMKKAGVTTLPSGLQYEVINKGMGAKPGPTSKVKTHYHGTLINGTVFDSSVNRGEPISFPVNGVIQGWQEALQLMSVGDKWRLFIPYNLAYGSRGAGQVIPPYAALIFEVELLDIEK